MSELRQYEVINEDENMRESEPKDEYQDVAEEIVREIKDDLFDYADFDSMPIVNVLRRRFDVDKENAGKILMSKVTMFGIYSGHTFEIPTFGMLAFSNFDVIPIISGVSYPNYNIRNKYMGYTRNGSLHRVNWWTEFVDFLKRNQSMILIVAIGTYMIVRTLFGLL